MDIFRISYCAKSDFCQQKVCLEEISNYAQSKTQETSKKKLALLPMKKYNEEKNNHKSYDIPAEPELLIE